MKKESATLALTDEAASRKAWQVRVAIPALLIVFVGTVAPLLVTTHAAAEPAAVFVEYSAPPECPALDTFESLVRRRTPLARFGESDKAHPLRIRIQKGGAAFEGHMSIGTPNGHRERDVAGDSCADVVDALALVTALALDPNASTAPTLPDGTRQVATPLPPQTSTAPTALAPALTPLVVSPDRAPAEAPTEPSPAASGPTSMQWHAAIGAGPLSWTGAAPDVLLGGAVFVEVDATRAQFFAPSVRVAALGVANGIFESPAAHIWVAAGRVEACPVRLGPPTLSARACVALDAGGVHAVAVDIAHPLPAERLWVDVTPLLRGRWAPGTSGGFVDLDVGALVPVTRPTFFDTTPTEVVHAVPSVGLNAMAAVGWRFR
jgi:hypothetical protein